MSFDLFFCSPNAGRINFESVVAWATEYKPFVRKENQLWYSNEDTGVYFSLDFEPIEPESPEDSSIPQGYFDSGLSFDLNFNRPSFFAKEAMPLVENLAKRFSLWVFDPQSEKSSITHEVEEESLIDSWLRSNQRAIQTLTQHEQGTYEPLRMQTASSLYLWRYNSNKKSIEHKYSEELYTPSLVPVFRKGSKLVERAFTCTQGVPTVVPDSEWVFLVRGKKGVFGLKKKAEVGVVSRQTFDEVFRGCISELEDEVPPLKQIRHENVEKVSQLLASFKRMLPRADLEISGLDAFVDSP